MNNHNLIRAFAPQFSNCIWHHVQVLLLGAILAPGRRTVTAVLRIMGLSQERQFQTYHRVLNRAVWSSWALSRTLLGLLVKTFVPTGPIICALDPTLERRRGAKIKAKGIYRDPVRSSKSHFVKASGLRWLSLMLLAPIPWAGRVWALPFLTCLAPSERFYEGRARAHKKVTDWGRQMILQLRRWLPERLLVIVADSEFAAILWLFRLTQLPGELCLIVRLRLDAALYKPAPKRKPGTPGRPRKKGERLPTLEQVAANPKTRWQRVTIRHWYGEGKRVIEIVSQTAVWFHGGLPPLPIRWVLIRDPKGKFKTQALLCTDVKQDPVPIIKWFVLRWQTEIVFPQMTKTDLLARGAGGDHITDLHLVLGDDHPIDEQFDQLPLLLKVDLAQANLDPTAKRLDRGHQAGQLRLAVDLRLQLPRLGVQGVLLLLQIAPSALVLGQRNDAMQIGFTETLQLRLQLDLALAQGLAARLQFLRQPVAAMGPLQRMGNQLGMGQDAAYVLPDQVIQLPGRDQAGRTALVAAGLAGRRLAPTDIVAILSFTTTCASQIAGPTTNQRPQQIVMRRVVAAGELLVVGQLGLHLIIDRLADKGWNGGHWEPVFRWRGGSTIGRTANRMGGRSAHARRPQLRAAEIDLPSIGRVRQNPTNRGLIPAPQAAWRGQSQGLQMPGEPRQAGAFAQVPGKHLLDHRGFRFVALHAGRVARPIGIDPIPIGHVCPGQQGTRLQFALSAAAHPLGDQGPLVFGHRAADLQQQLVVFDNLNQVLRRFR